MRRILRGDGGLRALMGKYSPDIRQLWGTFAEADDLNT